MNFVGGEVFPAGRDIRNNVILSGERSSKSKNLFHKVEII